jgi:hypothetical protein
VSAREATLRAYPYYRAALLFMGPRTIPALDRSAASTACLRTAATLLDPPFEVLAIPFGGATLPGYLLKPDASGTPRPALLMLGSSDTVVEDLYAYIDPAGLRRSYSAHVVDLPGQGPAVCGLVMRPHAKVPMRAVARWAAPSPIPSGWPPTGTGGGSSQRVSAYEVVLHLFGAL